MQNSLIILVPPIIVFFLAFKTQKILFSLSIGILTGTLIANDFAIIPAIKDAIKTVWNTTQLSSLISFKAFSQSNNILLFLFLLVLGAIIILMTYSGGATAYRNFINKKIKTAKGAQVSSLFLSLFFFLDDSFSCVTVGSVMYPLMDKFKIARAKLAFLINSMAPTLAIIVPISSWSAAIILNISNAGVSDILKDSPLVFADPFYLYLGVIPFIFYSIITISSVWFIVLRNIKFGKMKKHEDIALKTGNLYAGKEPRFSSLQVVENKSKMVDFLFPLLFLIVSIILFILLTGDYYFLGGINNLARAVQQGRPIAALLLGGLLTFVISSIFFILKKMIKPKDIIKICIQGAKLLGPSIFLLILAWSLTDILNNQLLTGNYLASIFVKYMSIKFLPLLFFFITALTAIAVGSAWGSMAIMIPISIQILVSCYNVSGPILVNEAQIIYPLLGAILSGAVSGNHISPTSDTMVISSRSSGAYHMDHVKTQHTYAFISVFSTAATFLLSGMLIPNYSIKFVLPICLLFGVTLNFLILSIRNYLATKY